MSLMPAIFISHGPPGIAVMDSPASAFLRNLGSQLPHPKAIICISAHWESLWPMVSGTATPETIYDFGGPPVLFDLSYPCPGQSELAEEIVLRLSDAGMKAEADYRRGLDHGAWVPLSLMYPDADIPVVQVSVQTEQNPAHHAELGRLLAPLREEGVLIMGSGGATHNLWEIEGNSVDAKPPDYAVAFDDWLRQAVIQGRTWEILDYKTDSPHGERNHPYPAEHFLPLFVAMSSAGDGTPGRILHQGFMYGVLSMAAYAWD